MRRQKEGFAVPSDAEWSTYDVILLSSRLGARPNPLANWKHAIFCYWVVGDPEAIGVSFRGASTYTSASHQEIRYWITALYNITVENIKFCQK
jgi:hypothetical protein